MEEVKCKLCSGLKFIKNGFVRGMQRYRCSNCHCTFVISDKRGEQIHDNKTRNMVVRMYLNNCGFRRITAILEVPLTTVFSWIRKAGKIVDEMIKTREHARETIEVLEMDELYTYIKKMSAKHEYGLLSIGTDSKMLHLR